MFNLSDFICLTREYFKIGVAALDAIKLRLDCADFQRVCVFSFFFSRVL